jgi:hypothetical protein
MLAGDPYQGGATWAVLQYALGLERLGHEVFVVEPVDEVRPESVAYLEFIGREFGIRVALLPRGQPLSSVSGADLLLNVSGMLRDDALESIPIRVYLDLDPAFNQLWHEQGIDVGFEGHTHFATVGQAIANGGTRLPTCGLEWIATVPPVVLERWPVAERIEHDALTTVGNWRGYGSIEHDGVHYGQKAHSLRQFLELPRRSRERFELALDIHQDEIRDLEALEENGWILLDPRTVAGTPAQYADFVRGSRAELGIAKSGYVVSRCGWFSDRSACYLASGKPVLAQDTGFGAYLPAGAGLLAFETTDDAVAAIEELRRDYGRHARAARAIAEEYLDSDVVLTRLLCEVGALPTAQRRPLRESSQVELETLVGGRVIARRPSAYRSSAPILELEVALPDGRRFLLVKDLARSALTRHAQAAKPSFLHDPLREIDVYRAILSGADLGSARFYGALVDPKRDRYWLAIEKVQGVELYQVGELETWEEAMRWLARLHELFLGRDLPDSLLRYDASHFAVWPERARTFSGFEDLAWYGEVLDRLTALPTTLLHGELYPSNVLVANGRVCAVDWERAGVGPGAIDVAALTMGWAEHEQQVLLTAYSGALSAPPPADELQRDVDFARLYLAVQWLGWSQDWSPPPEHAQEFAAEARRLVGRLAL